MTVKRVTYAIVFLLLPLGAFAQSKPVTAPPKILLLVHQAFLSGKDGARQKLDVAMSRACEKLNLPNAWIDLEALTGASERLSFDPFESFEEIDKAATEWPKIYAGNRELGRLQGEILALISSERSIIAVRRDDVGYRAATIDLSKARVMRTLEVRVHPGREKEFVDAFQVLAAAYEKTNSDLPWVVYQVNAGMPSPAFIIFVPMSNLRQNDDLLSRREAIQEAEGESGFEQMQQVARDAYERVESNIYAIRPDMSHVSKEFAAEDPEFWLVKTASEPAKPESKKGETKEPPEKQR